MKIPLILCLLALSGCATVLPVDPAFPVAPMELTQNCAGLKLVPLDTKLSDLTRTVAENYQQYHLCSAQVDAWNDWYRIQSQIFKNKR
jgi:hypothetical protein